MMTQGIYPELTQKMTLWEGQFSEISEERQNQLARLADYITGRADKPVRLNFICTHNSRRSHLGMIWAAVAAAYYGMESVHTYSGGTEATAFNPRAIAALEKTGFQITHPPGENPQYQVSYSDDRPALTCFSKVHDHAVNPVQGYAAIMTCSDADENCPLIPGAELRLPITYEDPKVADDTPQESERYEERVAQIGREIMFAFSRVGIPSMQGEE